MLLAAQMNARLQPSGTHQDATMKKAGQQCRPHLHGSHLFCTITVVTILALLCSGAAYLVVYTYTCHPHCRPPPSGRSQLDPLTVAVGANSTSGQQTGARQLILAPIHMSTVQNNGWLLFAPATIRKSESELTEAAAWSSSLSINRRHDNDGDGDDDQSDDEGSLDERMSAAKDGDASESEDAQAKSRANDTQVDNRNNDCIDILHNSAYKKHLKDEPSGRQRQESSTVWSSSSAAATQEEASGRRRVELVKQAGAAVEVAHHHLNISSSSLGDSNNTIKEVESFSGRPARGDTNVNLSSASNSSTPLPSGESKLKQDQRQLVRHKRRTGQQASERGKPILNEFSFPANLVQGMRFVLMCQVLDGEPPIQIKWFKDNTDLSSMLLQAEQDKQHQQQAVGQNLNSPLDQIEMMSNDELGSSLLFRKVKQQHGGNYTCLASNHFGTSSYSSFMTVKVPPNWRIEPKDRETIMGEHITIDCQASGNPNPFIRWKFTSVQHDKTLQHSLSSSSMAAADLFALQRSSGSGGADPTASTGPSPSSGASQLQPNFKLINSNHHVQTLENGSLTIRQAGAEHEGLYLCEADNGVEPSLVKQIMLVVRRQAHFLDDIQVVLQQQQHQHQQQHLQADHSPGASAAAGGSLPTIQPLATQMGAASASGPIKSIKLAQNSSLVRLICTPYGDAPLQLDWLKDGRLIHTHSSNGPAMAQTSPSHGTDIIDHQTSQASSSSLSGAGGDQLQPQQQHSSQTIGHYHVNTRWLSSTSSNQQQQQRFSPASSQYLTSGTNGLESELLLTNLARHDAGLYTCAARNAYGQSDRKLRLIVQEQPEAPTIVDVAHISSRFISLRWLAPFDGNSPILKYVIEYRKQATGAAVAAAGSSSVSHEHHSNEDLAQDGHGAPFVGRSEKLMPLQANALVSSSLKQQQQQQTQSTQIGVFEQVGTSLMQQQQQHALQLTSGGAQVQHTVHDLEPMTRYSMRVIAVNALGASRPSVALSLRTEEEVPATVPTLVEASVLSSRSIKLRWTISYSLEHELIDGFFIGYRSFDSSSSSSSSSGSSLIDSLAAVSTGSGDYLAKLAGSGASPDAKLSAERPTFTYKTIRLTNQQQQAFGAQSDGSGQADATQQHHQTTPMLAPISTVTKTVPADALVGSGGSNSIKANSKHPQLQQDVAYVISNFEYVISGLERNTEYTILIQCFNKKGAGPASDPVVTKTLTSDPPDKLSLIAEDLSETSLRVTWHFKGEPVGQAPIEPPQLAPGGLGPTTSGGDSVDGFVLTFAKVAPRPKASSGHNSQKSLPYIVQQQQQQQPDSAARISQPNQTHSTAAAAATSTTTMTFSDGAYSHNSHNNQYNPPIQPSQLLDHQWRAVQLAPQQRQHVLKNLECGTWYAMKIWAFNKVGKGEPSELVTVSTRGKAPVAPDRRSFMAINSTQVRLHLSAWYDGGCEIEKFFVQYRMRTSGQQQQQQQDWILVSNNILKEQQSVVIRDLSPATGYELLIGASNHVGQTEAKYRFSTLDADGKPVVSSSLGHSFLGANLPSIDDEDNMLLDYATEDSVPGMSRELYGQRGSSEGGAAQLYQSTGTRWLLLIRQILNSPLTLLLAFCLFLVLLVLLVFHRFNSTTGADLSHSDRFNGGGGGGGGTLHQSAPNKLLQHCGGGGASIGRHCSIDATTTTMGGCEPPPPMSVTTNGSSSLNDSPARVNLPGGGGGGGGARSQLSSSTYAPLDCYNGGPYCAGQQQANQSMNAHYSTEPGNNCGLDNGGDNYAVAQQQHQQQHHQVDYYSPGAAAGTYAGVNRSATMEPSCDPMDQQQQHGHSGGGGQPDIGHQQYLMHMLMMSPHQQHNIGGGGGESATMARHVNHHGEHSDGAYSMTAAALTTLARQKMGGGGGILKPAAGIYSDTMQQALQASAHLTLGRQLMGDLGAPRSSPQQQQTFQRANNTSSNEMYQMSSFINTRTALQTPATSSDNSRVVQQPDVFNYYYKEATSGSTISGTTSGCGTTATSTTSGFGGGGSGCANLADIHEQHPQSSLQETGGVATLASDSCRSSSSSNDVNNGNGSKKHNSNNSNELLDNDIDLTKLDNFQDRDCDKLAAAATMTKNSQYDVPFKFKLNVHHHLK